VTTVRELHQEAMRYAQEALVERHRGHTRLAQELAQRAYGLETEAIALVPHDSSSEPTLSILYRSAASLAYQFDDYRTAQQQIVKGLLGSPPPDIENELKDLLRTIDFEQHLRSRGVFLEDAELALTMEGKAVGVGVVLLSELTRRLEQTGTVIGRTTSRLMGGEYQRTGRPPKEYRLWTPVVSAPSAGSFTMSIKLGTPDRHIQTHLWVEPSDVIDEIVKGVELVSEGNEEALREMIQHEGYYRNFVEWTKAMAPDGTNITLVGFASRSRAASLTRPPSDITEVMLETAERAAEVQAKRLVVRGVLDYADSRRAVNVIGLKTEDDRRYTIVVEEGMDDVVRSNYGAEVVVSGTLYPEDNRVIPDQIEPVAD